MIQDGRIMAGFEDLLNCPVTMKILLMLLQVDEAYSFQITRMTGHHSRMINTAIGILIEKKMVRIVQPKVQYKNIGDYYALTPHGRVIANSLREVSEAVESVK
jgi:predicted transcriptional regulator